MSTSYEDYKNIYGLPGVKTKNEFILQEGAGWEILEEILSVRKAIESVLVARLVDWDTSEMGELSKKLFKFTDKKYKYSVRRLGPAEECVSKVTLLSHWGKKLP